MIRFLKQQDRALDYLKLKLKTAKHTKPCIVISLSRYAGKIPDKVDPEYFKNIVYYLSYGTSCNSS